MHGEPFDKEFILLAASSASLEEQANSALKEGRFPDGSTPVKVKKRIWWAQVKSQYVEPEVKIDPSESLDFLFENVGKMMLKNKNILPPQDDIVTFLRTEHQRCFDDLIQWRDCPLEHRPVIEALIFEYWEVFDPSGAL